MGPLAKVVNTSSSTALKTVLDSQNAMPRCRIFSGVGGWFMGVPLHVMPRESYVHAGHDTPAKPSRQFGILFEVEA